jgi:transcriptional antiterminator RfaH
MSDGPVGWFCLRTRPKQEHIAAGHLRKELQLEVFLPRIRFRRATRHGPVWFTEALFPGYLFARFDLATTFRQVHHTHSVSGIVHFGNHCPSIPDSVIAELRSAVGSEQVHVIREEFRPGETVVVSGGVFHDLSAVVTRVMPSRERVAVLLEFLGRQTTVELDRSALVRDEDDPRRLMR